MGCQVTVYGVRGGFPAAQPAYMAYGGNTSCFFLRWGDGQLILDAGSGLAALGAQLAREGVRRADILLGHLHLDHLLGLVAFPLFYDPAAEVHLYGPRPQDAPLADCLRTLFGPPFWPLSLAALPATVHLHEITPGEVFAAGGAKIQAAAGNHPGGCLWYRVTAGEAVVTYALDCEVDAAATQTLTALAAGADLLVWDANFAPGALKAGWGHATWRQGLEIRRAAGARRLLVSHYDRSDTDEDIHLQAQKAREADAACLFAREGMTITL